jgi:hypothetical protein
VISRTQDVDAAHQEEVQYRDDAFMKPWSK